LLPREKGKERSGDGKRRKGEGRTDGYRSLYEYSRLICKIIM
jgi:hypothetical protein